jgi:hypothetical protein
MRDSVRRTEQRRANGRAIFGFLAGCAGVAAGCGVGSGTSPQEPASLAGADAERDAHGGTGHDDGVGDGGGVADAQGDEAVTIAGDATVIDDAEAGDDALATQDATTPTDTGTPDAVADAAEAAGPDGAIVGQPAMCGFSACPPGAPCPDLIVDRDLLLSDIAIDTRNFLPTDCAVVEGCIAAPGVRRLLRFDVGSVNVGTADLVVGNPATGACFEYSQCHMHYHFKNFARYTLYQPDGVTIAAAGHKQSFCLDDVRQYPPAPGPMPATPFACTAQGIHIGWEDIYTNDLDCQWIDITGVPAGSYVLAAVVDAAGALPESDYTNNEARVPVTILPQ